jgi:hypothetical protein
MENKSWEITGKRFVAFFDIMGFKELVERNEHNFVVEKLKILKNAINITNGLKGVNELEIQKNFSDSKAITFSDSIIIFTKEDTNKDLNKILLDCSYVLCEALKNGIGIKGAISFGNVTVDFENSLFFGRPIIDAYLLHDQIQLYSVIVDNNVERIINNNDLIEPYKDLVVSYKTNLKTGKVNHLLITPGFKGIRNEIINATKKIYETVSGQPRIYVDNTIDFLNFLTSQNK